MKTPALKEEIAAILEEEESKLFVNSLEAELLLNNPSNIPIETEVRNNIIAQEEDQTANKNRRKSK